MTEETPFAKVLKKMLRNELGAIISKPVERKLCNSGEKNKGTFEMSGVGSCFRLGRLEKVRSKNSCG